MITITAANLLDIWERAAGGNPADRALSLLTGCCELSRESAAGLSVGERDRRLLAAYRGLFGPRAIGRADCPECQEALELDLNLADFDLLVGGTFGRFMAGDYRVEWRMPSTGDMVRVATARTPELAREELIRRCISSVKLHDQPIPVRDWPEELPALLGEAIAARDPLVDLRIGLVCVRCGNRWSVGFDPADFLWIELNTLAQRLVAEVHRLATAYGWSEADILGMSAARRAAYLRMCGG